MRRRLASALAVCALSAAAASPSLGGGSGEDLLPDLDQAAPGRVEVVTTGRAGARRYAVGFGSAVDNLGAGPLLLTGRRPSEADETMTVDQSVVRTDGGSRTIRLQATLRYVHSTTHRHWHLLPFERYELRRIGGSAPLRRDAKTGFCLGDRYRARRGLPNQPPAAVLVGECGRDEPGLLSVGEGISVGYGDDYDPTLEGQRIDVTGLPAGRYLLVHRVNGDRRLLESDYANNTSSALLELAWPGGRSSPPRVSVLRRCASGARCG
ncbi:MAG: hypothetical protein H0V40_01555 [Actinobacteria bacterium]|nr:hypothetical protein [Actinomycetota bacterium]